jgi:hypothetical protein
MDSLSRSLNAKFVVRHDNEAPRPLLEIFRPEKLDDPSEEHLASRCAKPNEDDSMMQAGLKTTTIRKIQILSNQETPFVLRDDPHHVVFCAAQTFRLNSLIVVAHGV